MNKVFLYCFTLLFCLNISAQQWRDVTNDYIINPSFEEYTTCPGNVSYPGQYWIDSCIGWYTPTYASSDYFNVCATSTAVGVPRNYPGEFQYSFEGNAHVGILAFDYNLGMDSLWSEYVQSKLKRKLGSSKRYIFSARVVRANDYNLSASKIGAHFSGEKIGSMNSTKQFTFAPTILNKSGFIHDTLNWTLINGEFIASGVEEYLTIGWFCDSVKNDTSFFIPPIVDSISGELLYMQSIYYFIDSLKLYEWEDGQIVKNPLSIKNFSLELISPNGDGKNDYFDFSVYELEKFKIEIYNRWGNLVFKSDDRSKRWEGQNQNNEKLPSAAYYYLIEAIQAGETIIKKGFVQLVY